MITEDILIKANFNEGQCNFKGYFYKDLFDNIILLYSLNKQEIYLFKANTSFNDRIIIAKYIKEVNELKNLFYALTGEELNI